MEPADLAIRDVTPGDLPAVHALLGQLGYAVEADEVKRRFAAVAGADGHGLLVAELAGRVIAFLHLFGRPALEKPPEAIVQALVVDSSFRGSGVGRRMMGYAERWAAARGFHSVALASQITREDAHAFYTRLGYKVAATSHLMRKELEG